MIYKFNPQIYPPMIWIMIGGDAKKVKNNFLDFDSEEIEGLEEILQNADAFTTLVVNKKSKEGGILMYFKDTNTMTYGTVAHESSHAAKLIFEALAIDMETHEPFEYLLGWLADSCYYSMLKEISINRKTK